MSNFEAMDADPILLLAVGCHRWSAPNRPLNTISNATPAAAVADPVFPVPSASGSWFGHPRGLTTLFLTELWERFSFYGMRALLVLFMVAPTALGGCGYSTRKAALIYGTYTMTTYMLAIPGGFLADNFLGCRRSVLLGGVIIACGHFTMVFQSETTFYAGLVLIALGTGLLKPSISTMVGSLYSSDDTRREAGFSIFYMGINLGAFVAPLVTGWIAQSGAFKSILSMLGFDPIHSWHWGFAAAGIGMTIGLAYYLGTGRRLSHVGNSPNANAKRPWGKLGLVLLGVGALFTLVLLSDTNVHFAWLRFGYAVLPIVAIFWFGFRSKSSSKHIAAILVFSVASMVFWAIAEQAGSTISLFGDQLTRCEIFHYQFPSAWFQSIGSLFVVLLAPAFAWLWLAFGRKQPSVPFKFFLGLVFLALSYLLMVPAARLTIGGKVSPLWIVGLFFVQTLGELCLAPVGLSTITKLAPPKLLGLMMGIWFLATALGNKLAGTLAGEFQSVDAASLARFFERQGIAVGCCALLLLASAAWVRQLMGTIR